MIGLLIIACEIGFWVFVIAGLVARYLLKKKTLGLVFLFCTPLIDLLLLIFTLFDLKNGATADMFHGLAAIYIGASISWGRQMIQWADRQFVYRFAGGENRSNANYTEKNWQEKKGGAGTGTFGVDHRRQPACFMILYINNLEQTKALAQILFGWTIVLIIDFLISFSYTIFPKKESTHG